MSKGKRFKEEEPKLNIKKVIAVFIAIIVIIMFVLAIKFLVNSSPVVKNAESSSYFSMYTNGKWGVIDNNAKTIIEPTYDEMIIIPDNQKDIFICTYDVDYKENTYKTKVINSKNKQIFSQYDYIFAIENHDENNNLWYENNVLKVEKDGKYGLIDFNGKVILECSYDEISALENIHKRILIKKENQYGLIDLNGTKIIEEKYKNIIPAGKDIDLYIVENEQEKYGIEGIVDCDYNDIKPINSKDVFLVKKDNEYELIDNEKNKIEIGKFDEIIEIKDSVIVFKKDQKYYAYDIKENKNILEKYNYIKITSDNNFIIKENDSFGIINNLGEEKIKPEYKNIIYYTNADIYELEKDGENTNKVLDNQLNEIITGIISDINTEKGYIKIWSDDGYKYYNFKGEEQDKTRVLSQSTLFVSKKDNKYGFINRKGEQVTDYEYDEVTEQNSYGYAAVKKDNLWGAIDKNGKLVCEIKYKLEKNLVIDFIGQYHLGEDINLEYYTDK